MGRAERSSGRAPVSVLTGFDQLLGTVDRAAHLAVVAVLIGRPAARAVALHEAVGEEDAGLRVVELRDLALDDVAARAQRGPHLVHEPPVRGVVRAAVVVEADAEVGEVALVCAAHVSASSASGSRPSFCARIIVAVPCVSSPQKLAHLVAAQALEAHPDVGLDVLQQVAEMEIGVHVGQGVR